MRFGWLAVGLVAAFSSGSTAWVKARNTRVLKSPAWSAPVLRVLQPGAEVTWVSADSRDPRWQHVKLAVAGGELEGVVFRANLSEQKPRLEVIDPDGGIPADVGAWASSAAAAKALGDGPVAYGHQMAYETAVDQLIELDAIA